MVSVSSILDYFCCLVNVLSAVFSHCKVTCLFAMNIYIETSQMSFSSLHFHSLASTSDDFVQHHPSFCIYELTFCSEQVFPSFLVFPCMCISITVALLEKSSPEFLCIHQSPSPIKITENEPQFTCTGLRAALEWGHGRVVVQGCLHSHVESAFWFQIHLFISPGSSAFFHCLTWVNTTIPSSSSRVQIPTQSQPLFAFTSL